MRLSLGLLGFIVESVWISQDRTMLMFVRADGVNAASFDAHCSVARDIERNRASCPHRPRTPIIKNPFPNPKRTMMGKRGRMKVDFKPR
jgi:hypothetical protein